jgi:hypothetical protein
MIFLIKKMKILHVLLIFTLVTTVWMNERPNGEWLNSGRAAM